MRIKVKQVFSLILICSIFTTLGWYARIITDSTTPLPVSDPVTPQFQASRLPNSLLENLDATWQLVEEESLFDIDQDQLELDMIQSILKSLKDPYAVYMNKEEHQKLQQQINNQYTGMGFDTRIENGHYYVANVLATSAADKAGLRVGDRIVAINEIPIHDSADLFDAAKKINTTSPRLTLMRGNSKSLDLVLEVTPYEEPVLTYEIYDKIIYIDINTFNEETPLALKKALAYAKAQNTEGIIFDVRFNMGGYMNACYDAISMVTTSETIGYETLKSSRRAIPKTQETLLVSPTVVLINQDSYSAAELFAQSLQTYGDALLIGTTTYGKGLMQSLYSGEEGTLKLSTAHFSAREDSIFTNIGVNPDIEVYQEYENFTKDQILAASFEHFDLDPSLLPPK